MSTILYQAHIDSSSVNPHVTAGNAKTIVQIMHWFHGIESAVIAMGLTPEKRFDENGNLSEITWNVMGAFYYAYYTTI